MCVFAVASGQSDENQKDSSNIAALYICALGHFDIELLYSTGTWRAHGPFLKGI